MSGAIEYILILLKTSNKINYHILTLLMVEDYMKLMINVKFIEYNFIEKKIFNYDLQNLLKFNLFK